MEAVLQFIQEWGYVAVFLGSLVEGESVILTAGFLAHEGYLSLWKIMLVAFVGSVTADQTLYHVGRHYGSYFMNKHPKVHAKADRAFELLRKYGNAYIFFFRFIYGVRTISPIIIGTAGIGFLRFTLINFVAAIVWAISSCLAGYYAANVIMEHFKDYSKWLLAGLIGIAVLFYVINKIRSFIKYREENGS